MQGEPALDVAAQVAVASAFLPGDRPDSTAGRPNDRAGDEQEVASLHGASSVGSPGNDSESGASEPGTEPALDVRMNARIVSGAGALRERFAIEQQKLLCAGASWSDAFADLHEQNLVVVHPRRDKKGRRVACLVAANLARKVFEEGKEEAFERSLLYTLFVLQALAQEGCVVVHVHDGLRDLSSRYLSWLSKLYKLLPTANLKRISRIYVLTSSRRLRSRLWLARPFTSGRIWKKIEYVHSRARLRDKLGLDLDLAGLPCDAEADVDSSGSGARGRPGFVAISSATNSADEADDAEASQRSLASLTAPVLDTVGKESDSLSALGLLTQLAAASPDSRSKTGKKIRATNRATFSQRLFGGLESTGADGSVRVKGTFRWRGAAEKDGASANPLAPRCVAPTNPGLFAMDSFKTVGVPSDSLLYDSDGTTERGDSSSESVASPNLSQAPAAKRLVGGRLGAHVPVRVFGAPLARGCANHAQIPAVVGDCVRFLLFGAPANQEGIFRIPGEDSEVAMLKEAYNRGARPLQERDGIKLCASTNAVGSLLKAFFRELPVPVVPPDMYERVIQLCAASTTGDECTLAYQLGDHMVSMPQENFNTLGFLAHFLAFLAENRAAETKMTAENLTLVWAPNLMSRSRMTGAPLDSREAMQHFAELPLAVKAVKCMISHAEIVFPPEMLSQLPHSPAA